MLAPKRQSGRIHLRDSDGNLISPEQECLELKKYAQGLFTGPAFAPPEWEPLPSEWFAVDQWQWAFKQLVNHKAVPKDEASIVAWKQTAEQVSPILQQIASDTVCSLTPSIPDHWAKVQLAWIPKPNKSPTSPANLRTIGLMGADTKAFLQILKHHADYYVQQMLFSARACTVKKFDVFWRLAGMTLHPDLQASRRVKWLGDSWQVWISPRLSIQ